MAYLQAKGIVTLIGTSMIATRPLRELQKLPIKQKVEVIGSLRSAESLRARNAFDSATGPIRNAFSRANNATEKLKGLYDPLAADVCEGIHASIISEFDNPEFSLAVLKGPGETEARLRKIGDSFGDKRVAFIGYNPRHQNPAVWFESRTSLCQTMLFSNVNSIPIKPSNKSPLVNTENQRDSGRAPREFTSRIQKVSDSEFLIDRAVVEKVLGDLSELAKITRVAPDTHDGKVVGFRLLGVHKDGWLGVLGMLNGDRIETINGFDITSPDKALEAYVRLRMADDIKVRIYRQGAPITLEYRIR
jgi:general secretion pathway protein C